MTLEIFGYSMSLTWLLVLTIAFLVVVFLLYDTWCHTYWRRKGVVYHPALPIIGSLEFSMGVPEVFTFLAKKYGRVYGVYAPRIPMLVVGDPDMLRLIMVKNFSNFHNRLDFALNNRELRQALPSLEDERWREVRNLLTPTFSAAKMRQMSNLVNKAADKLMEHIGSQQEKDGYIECKSVFGSFVMDVIGSCAFGLDVDSQANPKDPFVAHARRAFTFDAKSPLVALSSLFPALGEIFNFLGIVRFIPKDVVAFFADITKKTVALRKSAPQSNKGKSVDFLQLMIDAQSSDKGKVTETKDEGDKDDIHADIERHHDVDFHTKTLSKNVQLTDTELVGQAIIFFTAGYETTNTLLGFVFYLLSTHPEIQEKLIEEVDEMTPSRDSVGYTSIATMPYLDQVVCETLRIYPPAAVINRRCTESFTYNGMTIEPGVVIFIPVYNIHHDEKYWPDPEKFDPDRFSKAEKDKRHPFAWLPFGAGPHNCIGMRFALMEAKMAIARLLQKYRFETCPQTEIPPKLGDNGFLSPPNGVSLRIVTRTDAVN
ncbi:cytochrome P450 3A24-like [Diadema antillarum]|uniref:cytochrome P450 3A24-like n=1 Tax=Diadema antillarum TaxID=105358 RepID=UPI003A8A85BF